jgi:hypothetical protein
MGSLLKIEISVWVIVLKQTKKNRNIERGRRYMYTYIGYKRVRKEK